MDIDLLGLLSAIFEIAKQPSRPARHGVASLIHISSLNSTSAMEYHCEVASNSTDVIHLQ